MSVVVENIQEQPQSIESFAGSVDIIEPPPDIRAVVDSTAKYVARIGPDNPYWGYYQFRLKNGDAPLPSGDQSLSTAFVEEDRKRRAEKKQEADEVKADAKKEKKKKPKPNLKERLAEHVASCKFGKVTSEGVDESHKPAGDKYTVTPPSMFNPVDIDIIRLTSLFVARNGRSFLAGLTNKEQRNQQFAFLKPTHPLFSFFQQLVDAYAQIINPPRKLLKDIEDNGLDMRKVLAGFTKIAKYNQYEIDVKNKTLENQEEELVAMALIDWHNFIVVETITFTQEEQEFLPAPRADIAEINRMLSQQSLGETEQAMQDQDMDTDDEEEDMDMDEAGDKEKEVEDVVVSSSSAQEIDDDEEELEIVRSQIFESSDASDRSLKFQRCTVCGENIPIEEITNHMRLELLNPKWKEQKQKQLDKQRDSTWASGAGIGASLGKLASRRTDVFVEKNQQAKVAKAPAAPTPAPTGSTIVWDGTADSREAVRVQARAVAASAPPAKPAPTPVHEKAPLAEEKAAPVAPKPAVNVISAGPAPPRPAPDAAQQAQMQQLQMQQQARLAAMQAQATAPQPPVSAPRPVAPPQPAFAPQHVPMQPLQSMMPQPQFQTPFGFPGQHPGMAPMGMNPMMPYGAMGHMVPQMEPPNKKARTGTTMPESEFAAMFPSPIIVVVVVPSNPQYASWNFNGQEIKLTITVTESVEALKEKLVVILGDMPVKKMKMNFEGGASDGVFLNKDNATLAFYNVGPHSRLRLGVKERGGK